MSVDVLIRYIYTTHLIVVVMIKILLNIFFIDCVRPSGSKSSTTYNTLTTARLKLNEGVLFSIRQVFFLYTILLNDA